MSGFIRGTTGTGWSFTIANDIGPGGGSCVVGQINYKGVCQSIRRPGPTAYLSCTITNTTPTTAYFTVNLTAAGVTACSGGGATGQYPWLVLITATNGATRYTKYVMLSAIYPGADCVTSGANTLLVTQAQTGGRYVFGERAFANSINYTLPTPELTSAALPLIPNSQFRKALRVLAPSSSGNQLTGRATATANPKFYPRPPCFFAFFWKPESCVFDPTLFSDPTKGSGFGEPYAYGDQVSQLEGGAFAFIQEGSRIIQWSNVGLSGSEATTITDAPSPPEFTSGFFGTGPKEFRLGQWTFSAMIFPVDPSSAANPTRYYQDGLPGMPPTNNAKNPNYGTIPFPSAAAGHPLEYSFGADRNCTKSWNDDAHSYNGLIRNCLSVKGTPTNAQLANWRSNPTLANAQALWGAGNILSLYLFDGSIDPELGQTEPDQTGHNGDCAFVNAGWLPWAPPPHIATMGSARIADASGLFEMVNTSGSTYAIRTKTGAYPPYGQYTMLMIGQNGIQFETTFYVTDGS
jgi:hypothetical protein